MPDENPTDTTAQHGNEPVQESFQTALIADLRERFSTELTAKESVLPAQIQALLELLDSGSITAAEILKALRDASNTSTPAADE